MDLMLGDYDIEANKKWALFKDLQKRFPEKYKIEVYNNEDSPFFKYHFVLTEIDSMRTVDDFYSYEIGFYGRQVKK